MGDNSLSQQEIIDRLSIVETGYDKLFYRIFNEKLNDKDELLKSEVHDHECNNSCGRRALYVILMQDYFEEYQQLVLKSMPLGFEEKENFLTEFEYSLIEKLEQVRDDITGEKSDAFDEGVETAFKNIRDEIHSVCDSLKLL